MVQRLKWLIDELTKQIVKGLLNAWRLGVRDVRNPDTQGENTLCLTLGVLRLCPCGEGKKESRTEKRQDRETHKELKTEQHKYVGLMITRWTTWRQMHGLVPPDVHIGNNLIIYWCLDYYFANMPALMNNLAEVKVCVCRWPGLILWLERDPGEKHDWHILSWRHFTEVKMKAKEYGLLSSICGWRQCLNEASEVWSEKYKLLCGSGGFFFSFLESHMRIEMESSRSEKSSQLF